jgi:hypothetical protein
MKKIILATFSLLLFSQAHALTLEDCAKYSDAEIAKIFMDSIALGGQTATGNPQCLKAARALDVSTMNEELWEANIISVESENDARITRIDPESEENMYSPVVHFVVRKSNGTQVSGDFSFSRHTSFMDPSSINTLKCASISNPPAMWFMLKGCK